MGPKFSYSENLNNIQRHYSLAEIMNDVETRSNSYEEGNSNDLTNSISAKAKSTLLGVGRRMGKSFKIWQPYLVYLTPELDYDPIPKASLPLAPRREVPKAKKWEPCKLADDPEEERDDLVPFGAILPGHGDPGADCGSPTICKCNHCGNIWETESKCMKRECPNCWKPWLMHEADVSGSRMWVLTNNVYYGRHRRRIVHVTISLPYQKGQSFYKMRSKAMGIAMKHGLSGGLIICHTHRAKEDEYVPDGYVHYHIAGVAGGHIKVFEKGEKAPYLFKVIKDKRFGDYRGIRTLKELKRLIGYQLSHCGIVKGHHSLAWFGSLSYNYSVCGIKFNTNERVAEDFPKMAEHLEEVRKTQCPKCGSTDVHVIPAWMVSSMLEYDFHPEVTEWLRAGEGGGGRVLGSIR